jgi:hypothetical protein
MIEVGERLALDSESLDERLVVVAGMQDLDRDAMIEAIVVSLGKIDVAHAAAADELDEPVVADALIDPRGGPRGVDGGVANDSAEMLVGRRGPKQLLDLPEQRSVVAALLAKEFQTRIGGELECRLEQGFDA